MTQKNEGYRPEDMTFVEEEEVFPTVDAHDLPVNKEVNDVVEAIEEKQNGKRKLPEETADKKAMEKKVGPSFQSRIITVSFLFGYLIKSPVRKRACLQASAECRHYYVLFNLMVLDCAMHFILNASGLFILCALLFCRKPTNLLILGLN